MAVAKSIIAAQLISTAGSAFSATVVDYGSYQKMFWNWSGENGVVPTGKILKVILS
jgi:hypothetical protein